MHLKTCTLPRLLLIVSILQFSGCSYLPDVSMPDISLPDISLPSFGFGEEEKPKEPAIPISVAYAFDPSVAEATLEIQACDLPYTLQTGESIVQNFLTLGQETFQSVTAYAGTGEAVQATRPSDLIIQIGMVNQSFREVDRMAEEDNYLAHLDFKLQAVFIDRSGAELGQIPLNYGGQVRVWAPAITGQSVTCTTGQYDAKINGAAAELAQQLVGVVPQVLKDGGTQSLMAAQDRQPAFTPATPQQAPRAAPRFSAPAPAPAAPGTRPFFTFRTMLKDGNDNLILEGGEAVVLIVEATNLGSATITTATANVTGNTTLVEAFAQMTTLPISMGTFQPGETRTTEIRGRMPVDVPGQKAELVVSLQLEDGTHIGAHRIVAPIQPGTPALRSQAGPSGPQTAMRQQKPTATKTKQTAPVADAYAAMLVGMDTYQEPWPEAYRTPEDLLMTLRDTLQSTGLFSNQNIRVLQGSRAGKSDITTTLLTWVRQRINKESVLVVYFSGQAVNDQTNGEVYLVPYEGSPEAAPKRLISLRTLQRLLGKLDNRLTLLILDAPVARDKEDASSQVRWASGLSQQAQTPVIQLRKRPGQENGEPAGILAGLLGSADANQNGTVTVREFLADVSEASEVSLLLPDSSPLLSLPLAR